MDRHLISVDELRAAGALDVPAAWRRSLSTGALGGERPAQRDLFSDLEDDDSPSPEQPARAEGDSGDGDSPDTGS